MHRWAAAVALPAAVALIVHDPAPAIVAYGAGLVVLFAVSGAYHWPKLSPVHRHRLRRADHAAIYLFIALAYLPFCQAVVPGTLGEVVAGLVLVGGAAGVVMKLVGFERTSVAGAVLYVALGWLAVVTFPTALRRLSLLELGLLGASGALYTVGAVMLALRRPDPIPEVFGYHEIWHLCVVVASASYFVLVWHLGA